MWRDVPFARQRRPVVAPPPPPHTHKSPPPPPHTHKSPPPPPPPSKKKATSLPLEEAGMGQTTKCPARLCDADVGADLCPARHKAAQQQIQKSSSVTLPSGPSRKQKTDTQKIVLPPPPPKPPACPRLSSCAQEVGLDSGAASRHALPATPRSTLRSSMGPAAVCPRPSGSPPARPGTRCPPAAAPAARGPAAPAPPRP